MKIRKIITLCGSTKFKKEFIEINKILTLEGNIVISVGLFGHSGDTITDEQKEILDEVHKMKIALANEIFIIDVNGYIGESTKSEIEFAKEMGIHIVYLSQSSQIAEKLNSLGISEVISSCEHIWVEAHDVHMDSLIICPKCQKIKCEHDR